MKKLTKIVATISDRRCEPDFIRDLYIRGMNVARLNTAHQSFDDTLQVVKNIRSVSEQIAILLDTKGPEVRTSKMDNEIVVKTGDLIKFKGDPEGVSQQDTIYVNYSGFVQDVPTDCSILVDDGDIQFDVIEKKDDYLLCIAKNGGSVKGKKSVNVPCVHFNLPSLSARDLEYIDFAVENNLDFIAHSFVRNKEDVQDIQKMLDEKGSKIGIIAKIENQSGVDNIDEILEVAYGVMVARGDLGIEIPSERIPRIGQILITKCIAAKKPVIIATQMLHTMIKNPRPTRAEVTDIAFSVHRATDAIMLSGETAYGAYPFEAVETMTRVAMEVESYREQKVPKLKDIDVPVFIAKSAFRATLKLPIKAIICDTLTGRTARYLSAFRPRVPIFALCYNIHVMRQLSLSYGVNSSFLPQHLTTEQLAKYAAQLLLDKYGFDPQDQIVLLGGNILPTWGTSFMNISSIDKLMQFKVD